MKSKCCNEELLTIYLDGAQQGLGHPYCSKCGKVDRVMTTTPQLPPDLEKQFDEELGTLNVTHIPIRVKKNGEVMQNAGAYVKHFLAQALEDQKEGFLEKVGKLPITSTEANITLTNVLLILRGKETL